MFDLTETQLSYLPGQSSNTDLGKGKVTRTSKQLTFNTVLGMLQRGLAILSVISLSEQPSVFHNIQNKLS